MRTIILFLTATLVFSCQNTKPPAEAQLGDIELEVSGSQKAIPHFKRGLLLLHNFEYRDARASFQQARQIDPDMAMAYWGVAMTFNHPLWAAQYTDTARVILNDLAPTPEERLDKAPTEIEKDFMAAVNILYNDDIEEKLERDKAYYQHMKNMYEKYEGNHEVAAFYALSVLGASPERDAETYGKGAIIVKGILAENPTHPGALHYLIHSYDDPDHAHLALEAANSYSKVAADAGHALHMPSHIYVALGMWDEVISSNIASYNAADAKRLAEDLEPDTRNYHALEWLMYGCLQKGDRDTARTLLENMLEYKDEKPSPRARGYALQMLGGYLANTAEWEDPVATTQIDVEDLNVVFYGLQGFIKGMHAYSTGDMATLSSVIDSLQEKRITEGKLLMQRGTKMCSGLSWFTQLPTQSEINHTNIMEMELRALLAKANGAMEEADEWFAKATELEENTSFMFGPPVVVKPSFEMYAEFLYEQGSYDQALKYVNKALEKTPGRRIQVLLKSEIEQNLNAI